MLLESFDLPACTAGRARTDRRKRAWWLSGGGPPRCSRTFRSLGRASDRRRRGKLGKLVLPANKARRGSKGHDRAAHARKLLSFIIGNGPAEGIRCGCERIPHAAAIAAQTNRMTGPGGLSRVGTSESRRSPWG